MSDVYSLEAVGTPPVSLTDMKAYMKVTSASDNDLITSMIEAATRWGENYTGRDFRVNTWKLLKDEFESRICLRRDPVASITTVEHLVSGSLVAVSSSVYYLKKNIQSSEILLNADQEWPTNTDDREQVVEITFDTEAYHDIENIITAIKRHVAFWYQNRGDCSNGSGSGGCDCQSAAVGSGVTITYDQFRISRV